MSVPFFFPRSRCRLKKDWAIKALQAKKHVVLEKPVALSAKDYQEVLQVAYANNKFLLDGTMFPHHKRTEDILQKYVTNDGSLLGSIRRLDANFTFMTDEGWEDSDIRAKKDGDPQGCIGDLGWYCIRFGLMVFDKLDSKVTSAQVVDYTMNKNGVPVDATCVVKFENVSLPSFQYLFSVFPHLFLFHDTFFLSTHLIVILICFPLFHTLIYFLKYTESKIIFPLWI